MIESQIDDMSGEEFGFVMETLLNQSGILDVYYTSIQMKKNRPGVLLTVLAKNELREKIVSFILRSTTTFGVRYYPVNRTVIERQFKSIETPYGWVQYKIGTLDNQVVKATPEYDQVKEIAIQRGLPITELIKELKEIGRKLTLDT
ncbi:DUF111 family protein [Aerococcaceae bacterium zg-BR22]|uniref:nickel insertion protein n=1 Tax=Aerococcaceae bacterium zg-1292 TaxID=2774330 RepID=UPI004062FD6C|nr:DUF111 family protein [Aerococcaceae bacterium zg-BR22]